MTHTTETFCRCNPCPGAGCTCGCQKTAQQSVCACSPQCLCGDACGCART
jgi:hypothetical protein